MKPIDMIPGFAPTRTVEHDGQCYKVTVQAPAFMKQPPRSVLLTEDQFRRYQQWREGGILIQEALPELSGSNREILMSGLGDDMGGLADDEDE